MSELQEAFREAARREFSMVPAEEDLHWVFSRRFERRMRRIIRAQEYGYWNLVNTTAKRAAIVAAIIVMLLSSVMAIRPIRERVIKFFVDVYEEYFEIHFGEEESWDLPERTEPMVRYTLTELPEGYEEVEFLELEHVLWTSWQNEDGYGISLQQESGTQEITINIMDERSYKTRIGELEVLCQEFDDVRIYVWEEDGYIFYLALYETFLEEQIAEMIMSVTKK